MARRLGRKKEFSVGLDRNNAVAALQSLEISEDDVVVFLVADTGEKILSKFHSDEWMKESACWASRR